VDGVDDIAGLLAGMSFFAQPDTPRSKPDTAAATRVSLRFMGVILFYPDWVERGRRRNQNDERSRQQIGDVGKEVGQIEEGGSSQPMIVEAIAEVVSPKERC